MLLPFPPPSQVDARKRRRRRKEIFFLSLLPSEEKKKVFALSLLPPPLLPPPATLLHGALRRSSSSSFRKEEGRENRFVLRYFLLLLHLFHAQKIPFSRFAPPSRLMLVASCRCCATLPKNSFSFLGGLWSVHRTARSVSSFQFPML